MDEKGVMYKFGDRLKVTSPQVLFRQVSRYAGSKREACSTSEEVIGPSWQQTGRQLGCFTSGSRHSDGLIKQVQGPLMLC